MYANNKSHKFLFLIIALSIFVFCGCSQQEPASEQNQESTTTYTQFVKAIHSIRSVDIEGFTLISTKEGVANAYMTMPETKLDDRTRDDLPDGSPSKYLFEFVNDNEDVYIRTTFLYYTMNDDGILLQSVISPDTKFERTEKYAEKRLQVPFTSSDIISINGYTVLVESVLMTDAKKGSNTKKTSYLLGEEQKFIKGIQNFLIDAKL